MCMSSRSRISCQVLLRTDTDSPTQIDQSRNYPCTAPSRRERAPYPGIASVLTHRGVYESNSVLVL